MNVRAHVGWWSSCVFVLLAVTRAAATGPSEIVLYATDAINLHGNWTKTADGSAAGGQVVTSADLGWSTTAAPVAAPADYFDFTFNAEGGVPYRLWLRLRAGANSKWNDSLWAQFSDTVDAGGAATLRTGTTSGLVFNLENCSGCGTSGWGWPAGAYWITQPAIVRFAATGSHSLRLQTREDGVALDQVLLSPATYFSSAPGPVTNDNTIVPKPVVTSPYLGQRASVPGTIQSENFDEGGEGIAYHDSTPGNTGAAYRTGDVDLQGSSEGGQNVGWVIAGEWLNYSVNVLSAGTYLLEARVASSGQGGGFHLEANGNDFTGAMQVPDTGGWQNWTTVSKTVTLQAGAQVFRLVIDTSGPGASGNFNWLRLSPASPQPYTGTAVSLPGTLRADQFDDGGEGIAYHDDSAGNSGGAYRTTDVDLESSSLGGYNVGWIGTGEWLRYSVNFASAGTYTITARVASPGSAGRLHADIGSVSSGTVGVPLTGGWQSWTTVVLTAANVPAGPSVLKVVMDAGGFNLADMAVALVPVVIPPPQPVYTAIADRIPRPKPALPALGPAGAQFADPAFGSTLARVTDASTRPATPNRSYRTASASHQVSWNATSTRFYVVSTDGTIVPYTLDPATGMAARIPSATGDGGLTLQFNVEPEFSSTDANLLYGVIYNGARTIARYDFDSGTYSNFLSLDTIVAGLSGTYVGGLAIGGGPGEKMMAFFGGTSQDQHRYALWFPTSNTTSRKLLDTMASTLNGSPTGVLLNFKLHSASIDKGGRYVFLYPRAVDLGAPRYAAQVYLWDTTTDVITALTSGGNDGGPNAHAGGHDAPGFGYSVNHDCCVNSSWDAGQWEFRSLAQPLVAWDLIGPVMTPQEIYLSDHPSWNNARPDLLVPFISGTFRYGTNPAPWRAWDDEIIAVQTDAAANATVWRFAHHRSAVGSDGNPTVSYFWYQPRPNVSPDGRWAIFTSNWEKTLGSDPGTGTYRQDVFLLALR